MNEKKSSRDWIARRTRLVKVQNQKVSILQFVFDDFILFHNLINIESNQTPVGAKKIKFEQSPCILKFLNLK